MCLINIYLPTQDYAKAQDDFIEALLLDIANNNDKNLIIGGDFNMQLSELDHQNSLWNKNSACAKLMSSMEDLIDLWRILNPNCRRYTWRHNNPVIQTRLDFWIVATELLYNTSHCDIKPSIKTDHSLITLQLKANSDIKRGKGLWKFDNSLLSDDLFVDYLNGMIDKLLIDYEYYDNLSLKWEIMKMDLRTAIIGYSKTQAKLNREEEKYLIENLNQMARDLDINPSKENFEFYNTAKHELERLNALKTEGYRIRSRAKHIEENEKGTKYFLNLEKRRAQMKNITKLKLENNETITDSKSILDEQKEISYEFV